MKTLLFSFIAIFIFEAIITTNDLKSQNNQESIAFFLTKEGAKSRIAHFNRRNRTTGFTDYEVISVSEKETGKEIRLRITKLDQYQNPLYEKEHDISYTNGELVIPAEYLLFTELPEMASSSNNNVRERDIIIPAFLGNGMSLTSSFIEIDTGGTLPLKVSDFSRTVNNFESIETPAGDFQACVISSKREVQNEATEIYTVYTWISQGVGVVKTQYFNDRLRLVKYSKIIELVIPEV